MKNLILFFGIYLSLGLNYDKSTEYHDEYANLYNDQCFKVVDLTCGIERRHTSDPYLEKDYDSTTIYIEKTFTIKE